MAKQIILGTDTLPVGYPKINENFDEIYDTYEIQEISRKTLNPYKLVTYLPRATPYTTASITLNTPTKLLLPTTVKYINNFELFDLGGGNLAYRYIGALTELFNISLTTGLLTATNNTVVTIELYVNGVFDEGLSSVRKISSADVGNITVNGVAELDTNDYIEIYITTDATSTVTFSRTSIVLLEIN